MYIHLGIDQLLSAVGWSRGVEAKDSAGVTSQLQSNRQVYNPLQKTHFLLAYYFFNGVGVELGAAEQGDSVTFSP
jgi:hypothetical protein